jgi:hypothetical protein
VRTELVKGSGRKPAVATSSKEKPEWDALWGTFNEWDALWGTFNEWDALWGTFKDALWDVFCGTFNHAFN